MCEATGSPTSTIPANPDIAGVGVRSAIYAQNLLCILSALWALWNGQITPAKLEYAEVQTTTNLILAFAILISSAVQANTLGISNYHGNIVLMMSWMNNTNAFVYFILYIQHKAGLQESEGRVDPTLRAWVKHVRNSFSAMLSGLDVRDVEAGDNLDDVTPSSDLRGAKIITKRFVLVLGSLHLTLMAALGVWLWRDPRLFGMGNRKPEVFKDANALAMDKATVAILGQAFPLGSPTLRVFSIIIYALFLIPGVNLLAPMFLFLAVYFGCRRVPSVRGSELFPALIGLVILWAINILFIVDIEVTRNLNRCLQDKDEADWGFGQILAILLLLLPLRDLVEAILARRLKQRQKELDEDLEEALRSRSFDRLKRAIERGSAFPSPTSPDEHCNFWTLIATHGALDYFDSLRRTRMTNIDKALEGDLHSALEAKDSSRISAVHHLGADLIAGVLQSMEAAGVVFWYAIRGGYDQVALFHARQPGEHVNEQGPDGTKALILALEKGDNLLAKALLENPFTKVNIQDATGQTAFIAATHMGHDTISRMLIERGDFQPNAVDHIGQTPLIWASRNGFEGIVKMLLERGDIEPNAADEKGQTALLWASQNGHEGIAKTLLGRDDIQPNAADEDGRTPIMYASGEGHEGIAEMLLGRDDIQPNAADYIGRTPLIRASQNGQEGIVKMLLERKEIQPNAADEKGQTPLHWASGEGHEGIAKMLLERDDVQPNAVDGDGRTPLIWASQKGHEGIIKMLLERNDIRSNVEDKNGQTPLFWALQKGHTGIATMLSGRGE